MLVYCKRNAERMRVINPEEGKEGGGRVGEMRNKNEMRASLLFSREAPHTDSRKDKRAY